MQKWMKENRPKTTGTSAVSVTIEIFVVQAGNETRAQLWKFDGNIMPIETKRFPLKRSVFLSDGQQRVRANVYGVSVDDNWISRVIRDAMGRTWQNLL